MWLVLLAFVVVIVILLCTSTRTVQRQTVISDRYRVWVTGKNEKGEDGRYYLVAYGLGKKETSTLDPDAPLISVGGTTFFYFRPAGDEGTLTTENAAIYLAPIGGIANTTYTEYFSITSVGSQITLAPSGTNFGSAPLSVCNDASQCVPKILRFNNGIGASIFESEVKDDGYLIYQLGNGEKNYIIVGNTLCPAGELPPGTAAPIVAIHNFTATNCASLPGQQGGPRMAIVGPEPTSVLHFAK